MPAAITASAMRTCLGDTAQTFKALLNGDSGVKELRHYDSDALNVARGYHIDDGDDTSVLRCSRWLGQSVAEAVRVAGIDTRSRRVSVVVGTGLRELHTIERWSQDEAPMRRAEAHFASVVRDALGDDSVEVITLSNACAASGYALALAQDMLDLDEADAVIVAGCDSMSESMLAMIGRITDPPTEALRPFERTRTGVLLGEGAVAVVLEPVEAASDRAETIVRGVGLSCDAFHETAPDADGIVRSMLDAHERAGVTPEEIGLVVAHGTGTALNDPTESTALLRVFEGTGRGPLVTGIKGATGHTSGGAALMGLVIAGEALRLGQVPAVVGLDDLIDEAEGLRFVKDAPVRTESRIAQVDSFGFGGVNAVAIIEVNQ